MPQNKLDKILKQIGIHPTLIDVGASGEQFPTWESLKSHAIYVGFDPDDRDFSENQGEGYHQYHLVNKAVTDSSQADKVDFFLTKFPYCSSTLKPLPAEVGHYHFASYFEVVGNASAPAITLDQALEQLHLNAAHWIKLDSQGTDLRIFQSLSPTLKKTVLTVDIEPGLINSYENEDLFVDAHQYLIENGFWLSRAEVKGAIRVKPPTLEAYSAHKKKLLSMRTSPGWIEARYLRKVETIDSQQDHQLLWLFAIIDDQPGYALDILASYQDKFQTDSVYEMMKTYTIESVQPVQTAEEVTGIKRYIPYSLKHSVKMALQRLFGS